MSSQDVNIGESIRVGYLVSQYPAVNHTFILREIRALRGFGLNILAVSVKPPDRPAAALSSDESEESRLVFTVLGPGTLPRALAAHVRTLVSRPLAYSLSLGYSLRLAGWDVAAAYRHLLWFAEAVVAGDYFRRSEVRHVHTHFSSTVALLMARLFGMTFSLTVHGPDEFNDVVAFHMAEKVRRAIFIAAISSYAASQTMRASDPRYWAKVHRLPLGIQPDVFAPAPRSSNSGPFHILCVGRLAPAKAHHILIAALSVLVARGRTNIVLTVVGDGPSHSSLETAIAASNLSDFVRLAGACNHDRVIGYLRKADAFALASFAEGVPVVLMEAMAMEIPCVATWITGIPELIRHGVDGLLIPPADPEALADAIELLMDNPDFRLTLGKSARERVASSYNLSANAAQLATIFRGCMQPASSSDCRA